MMRRALLLSLVACGHSPSSSPPSPDGPSGPTGPIAAHVTGYAFTFDLDSRAAHATVTAVVDTAGDCFTLPLRATPDTTTAKVDGAPAASATVDDTTHTVTLCGAGDAAGATLTLDLDEQVALGVLEPSQVGYSMQRDDVGNPFYYLVSWVSGCDQFAPCDNRPDLFATYHFTVTHQAGVTVTCPGTLTQDSDTQTECDFPYAGGPTYSTFGIAASKSWLPPVDEGMWGDVHVTLYDRGTTGTTTHLDTAWNAGFVSFMESTFGPYPFGSDLRVITAPTYWNGFEHPGNIVLADTLTRQRTDYKDNLQHTLDHEMAHMWAGDQTTLADPYDFAWKESMAEYLPFVYEDSKDAVTSRATSGAWKAMAYGVTYYPVPDDKPPLIDYYGDVYGAGPMIFFRQVEALTSRAAVITALQSLLGQPRAISVDDVVAALSASTGVDLTAYAQSWLHGTGTPVWPQFDVSYDGSASTLTLHQSNQSDGVRGCAFHVALQGSGGDESVEIPVDTLANGPDQTLNVAAPAFAVTSTVLDPDAECLVFPTAVSPNVRGAKLAPWVAR